MVRKRKTIVGIKGSDAVARAIARFKKLPYVSVTVSKYRAGEAVARTSKRVSGPCVLVRDIEANPVSIWEVLMAEDALKNAGAKSITLLAPWMAYGRQDRIARSLESIGGKVLADELSSFRRIITVDAHSPMFIKRFKGRLKSIPSTSLIVPFALRYNATLIASPDAGGFNRAFILARHMHLPLSRCDKKRIKPGLLGVRIVCDPKHVKGARVLLIDDMVDSGGTLREATRNLKKLGARSVSAVVTHVADPNQKPSARELGLSYLMALYPRNGKVSEDFIKLLSDAIR
jgi:ribose-phosphate pyrophosphokinase